MGRFIARRLFWLLVVMLFVSLITFGIAHAVPGGPFSREKKLPPAVLKQLNAKYNLDDPLWKQYVDYIGGIFIPRIIQGEPGNSLLEDHLINIPLGDYTFQWMNFGPSYKSKSRTVNDVFRDNLPVSFAAVPQARIGVKFIGVLLRLFLRGGIRGGPDRPRGHKA